MKIHISLSAGSMSTENIVSTEIKSLVRRFHKSARAINTGDCEEFADKLQRTLRLDHGIKGIQFYATDFFEAINRNNPLRDRGDVFDEKNMARHWPKCVPLKGTTWGGMSVAMASYGHSWYSTEMRHYDAECPDGVENFFALPFYVRLAEYARKKKNWGRA